MPSLYEYTTPVGDVASGDFTTLYNASGLTVPNAGAGSVSGNLNVGGNLTVQGSSLLIGPVALQSTLSLPSYTFPTGDGTTYQVLTTDGSGNLTWSSVQTLPGANYTISASSTTGGANLDLVSGVTTDSVKFAEGTNITITRTDANTITIGTIADNIPDGTAQGQLLVWDGTAWTANSTVTFATSGNRTQFKGDLGVAGRVSSAAQFVNDTGATNYGNNDGSGILIGVDSDNQSTAVFASMNAAYYTSGNHEMRFNTSTDNFAIDTATSITGGNTLVFGSAHGYSAGDRLLYVTNSSNGLIEGTYYYVLATGLTTTQCQISLSSGGSAVSLTNGTGLNLVFNKTVRLITVNQDDTIFAGQNLTLNALGSGVAGVNANITVKRGTSGADAVIAWDNTDGRWELNNDLLATGLQGGNVQIAMGGSPENQIYIGGDNLLIDTDGSHVIQSNSPIQTSAESMSINSDSTATDSQLNFKGTTQYLKWNNTTQQFELSNAAVVGGNLTVNGIYSQTGESMTINSDSTAADSFLYMKGSTEYLKWNNTDTRFELSDQLFISQTESPVYLERQVTAASVNPRESATTLNLVERVTDAASNATDDAGPSIQFGRTSGTSPSSTVAKFANIGANYFGTTNTAEFLFNWSNDNYANPSTYPGTYSLLRLGSNDSNFLNNSIFVNYSAQGTSTDTATSITGGNTLVFGSAHGYTANQRIKFTSTTQRGLTQNAYYYVLSSGLTSTQCQLGLTVSSSPVALTNGTGLTLVFANLVNFVGINTGSPAYTLDVDGDARVTGDVITGGITAGNITVGVVTDNTISTTTGNLSITPVTGSTVELLADLTSGTTGPIRSTRTTTQTNTSVRALSLRVDSTGTPAVGLATVLDYEVETASGNFERGGYIEVKSTDITSGSENFIMNFGVTNAGTITQQASLDNIGNFAINGDLTVTGNDIKSSTGLTAITLDNNSVVVAGDITINGQDIKSNGGTTVITLSGNNATFAGDIEVQGQDIKSNGGTTAITLNGADITTGDITLNGGDIRSSGGTVAISVSGANATVAGDLAVNGGDITTTQTTATVFNTTATTVNIAGAATTVSLGATTGTTTVNNDIQIHPTVTDATVQIGSQANYNANQVTTTTTSATVVATTTRNSMNGVMHIVDTTTNATHIVNFSAIRNGITGTTALLTTWGELYSGSALANFTAEIAGGVSGGALRVLATPASTNSTRFNVVRTSIT